MDFIQSEYFALNSKYLLSLVLYVNNASRMPKTKAIRKIVEKSVKILYEKTNRLSTNSNKIIKIEKIKGFREESFSSCKYQWI